MGSAENILEVRGLGVAFPVRTGVFARITGWTKAVDGLSFELKRGETLALVGESGCGKSTTARAILGLVKPQAGEILLDGVPPGPPRERARKVQVVFQDPLASLNPRHTVEEIVTEGPVAHGFVAASARHAYATAMLASVGLDTDQLARYPHEFSGGQRQRISIARAVAMRPELLICDEAVSALDLSIRAQVLDLLATLKAKFSLSMLFITHDLGVVAHIADRALVMRAGRMVEAGPTAEILAHPREDYTRELIAAVPRLPQTPRLA